MKRRTSKHFIMILNSEIAQILTQNEDVIINNDIKKSILLEWKKNKCQISYT